ncbi:MAG: hypothetical protein AB1750_16495 [Chloroflexota bacterium]
MSNRLHLLERLCKEHRVKALYVFGSRSADMLRFVTDEAVQLQTSSSDLDVGASIHSPFSVEDKVNLTLDLESFFGAPGVDLFVLQDVDAFLAVNVIRGERVYAEDSYLADEYELYILRRAGDLADFERERMAMILSEA